MADPENSDTERERPHGRAFVTYRAKGGMLGFLKKSSPKLPVRSVSKEGMEFRSVEAPTEGERIVLSLRSQHHPKPASVHAEVSKVSPETRIGEQRYAFRVEVKFVEISSEAWNILNRLIG